MSDDAWKKLNEQVKAKRAKKGVKKTREIKIEGGEIIVQRLSAEVTGKAQKFSRIGPREFVPFQYHEVTIENIKRACEKHFQAQIGSALVCDVLAGEQGPSCKTVEQIPNIKVIHVRFISRNDAEMSILEPENESQSISTVGDVLPLIKRRRMVSSEANTPTHPSGSSPSKFYPRSLSVADMIKMGKLKKQANTTVVDIYEFSMDTSTWLQVPTTVEYIVDSIPVGEGGFRQAYKATTTHPRFKSKTWVLKKYLPDAAQGIIETGVSVKDHTKKAVQMHLLARNFTSQLTKCLTPENASKFGDTFKYRNVYYGETKDGECVTIEEYIDGKFTKYLNNNGKLCVDAANTIGRKAECLTHFSHVKSEGKLLLVDIQGSGYNLFDPEIASAELFDENEILFCAGNLSEMAFNNFTTLHQCNEYCEMLGLQKYNK